MLKTIAIFLINVYQKSISPDHGWFKATYPYGFCRFNPSCSQYAKEAIYKYGFFRGFFMGLVRIAKCNPWSAPAHDPVL